MSSPSSRPRRIGRYVLYDPIASGGMATVHLGRLLGEAGFSRTVAIKRLRPELATSPEIAASLLDEARIVSRIQHPSVVSTLDLLCTDEEAFLVMDFVRGESLARLLAAARAAHEKVPASIVASIACGLLHGLHAAHEARSESGEPLGIVHRDVSPENVLVGVDGTARLLDFGIAKAQGRLSITRGGQLKGKIAYMAPEQLLCGDVTRRTDVFAAGIVVWEALTVRRLFEGADEVSLITAALEAPIARPSEIDPQLPASLDAIVLQALERNTSGRHATARDFAIALESAAHLATPREVGEWVERLAGDVLARRAAQVARIEAASAEEAEAQTGSLESVQESADGAESQGTRAGGQPSTTSVIPSGHTGGVAVGLRASSPPSRRRALGLVALALALGAALLGTVAVVMLRPAREPIAPAEAQTPLAAPSALPSDPVLPSAAPAAPSAAPSERAAAAPGPLRAAPAARASSAASVPPREDAKRCNPPYTVDQTGLRRLKPECI